jgi:hypothetical protein
MKKYKVLMYGQDFVSRDLLYDGIYITTRPTLFEETETIESLTLQYENMRFISKPELERVLDNLQKCRLVDVNLQFEI